MIELTPFTDKDFGTLISWIDNEKSMLQFAGNIFTFPLTKNQLQNYLTDPNRNAFKVINKFDNSKIGHAEIYLEPNSNIAKLCRILIGEKELRGKGLGEMIVNELVRKAFEEYKVDSIELNVYSWNTSAIKCYKKVGFEINKNVTKISKIKDAVWEAINMTLNLTD